MIAADYCMVYSDLSGWIYRAYVSSGRVVLSEYEYLK